MKRFFLVLRRALALFVLFFFGLNLFDSRPGAGAGRGRGPAAAQPGAGQRLFPRLGLRRTAGDRPPGRRLTARQVLELFAARARNYLFRSRYGQWLARLNAGYRRHWQGATLYFPQLPRRGRRRLFRLPPRPDRGTAAALRRAAAALPPAPAGRASSRTSRPWAGSCPARSLLLATYTAKLFAASAGAGRPGRALARTPATTCWTRHGRRVEADRQRPHPRGQFPGQDHGRAVAAHAGLAAQPPGLPGGVARRIAGEPAARRRPAAFGTARGADFQLA